MNWIEHEEKIWNEIFQKELQHKSKKLFSSYWWEDYYREIQEFIKFNIIDKNDTKIDVIEIGSWSWKASIVLWKMVNSITLLDISKNALKYAKLLSKKFEVNNISFIEQDIFKMSIPNHSFHLTWNIGTLEHYNDEEIIIMIKEMLRVTKKWWYIAFGVPNEKSWPILKAKLLTLRGFSWISWYKLDTERFFNHDEIMALLKKVNINESDILYTNFWSFLPMEFPKIFIKLFNNKFINYKFLKFYLIKV